MIASQRALVSYLPEPARRLATRLGLEEKRLRHGLRELSLKARLGLGRGIRHLHGPGDVRVGPEELVVLCLVRNGIPWLRSYVRHHRELGAKHIVFLDNGSDDETVQVASSCDRVSVFATDLPFAPYHVPLKRWLIDRFGRGGWRLYCDVDELFEYPFSDTLDLPEFLGYLNGHGYTAVVAQVLDMFSAEPLERLRGGEEEDLEGVYRYYDLEDVAKTREKYWIRMNRRVTGELYLHRGGIRAGVFGLTGSMLTKHPLLRPDRRLRVFPYDDHFVTDADLADVTGLIRHYTFTRSLLRQIRQYTDPGQSFNIPANYRRYREVWRERGELSLRRPSAREYRSAEALLDVDFLIASERYLDHVHAHAP